MHPEGELIAIADINGYTATLERLEDSNDPERGPWLQCFVSNGRDAGSLECLEHEGEFMNGDKVCERTLSRVRRWVEAQGYHG
jgi:hypothetical protein